MQSLQIIVFPCVFLLSAFTVTTMNSVLLQILLKISATKNDCMTVLNGLELHHQSIFLFIFRSLCQRFLKHSNLRFCSWTPLKVHEVVLEKEC